MQCHILYILCICTSRVYFRILPQTGLTSSAKILRGGGDKNPRRGNLIKRREKPIPRGGGANESLGRAKALPEINPDKYTCTLIVHAHVHKSSEGLFSTTNPKPAESHPCAFNTPIEPGMQKLRCLAMRTKGVVHV